MEPISINDLPEDEKQQILSGFFTSECSLCGCIGIHACMGHKVEWKPEDIERLEKALSDMFGWKQNKE